MASKEGYGAYKHFLVSVPSASSAVAHVEINRPEKLNSFHEEMWIELGSIFKSLSSDSSVRAVVLSGAGDKAFSAGLDVQAASGDGPLQREESDGARKATYMRRHIYEFQECISSIEKCEKPVICVLHGYSFGLAIDIAVCADIRLCAAKTKLSVKEVDIGIAADIGSLSRLPKIVGNFGWVKDVTMTARVFTPEEAYRVGLVSHVLDTKEKAVQKGLEIAELIATKSPVAVQGTKEILNHARENTIADSLKYTAVWNSAMLQTEDFKQALLSGIQKRQPKFAKL